jgi:hypothetical protein
MAAPIPHLRHVNLLIALLRRWFALWIGGAPSSALVRVLEQTERDLASAIRATLTVDGVAFPDLPDAAFLVWFKRHCPGSDDSAKPRPRLWRALKRVIPVWASDRTEHGPRLLDRRLPAGSALAGFRPAVQPRAPP